MAYFQAKNPNLCKFGGVLQWKMFVYFMAICYILLPFGYVMVIWYIFPFWYVAPRKIWQPWPGRELFI
jgi:hypothetical protein